MPYNVHIYVPHNIYISNTEMHSLTCHWFLCYMYRPSCLSCMLTLSNEEQSFWFLTSWCCLSGKMVCDSSVLIFLFYSSVVNKFEYFIILSLLLCEISRTWKNESVNISYQYNQNLSREFHALKHVNRVYKWEVQENIKEQSWHAGQRPMDNLCERQNVVGLFGTIF